MSSDSILASICRSDAPELEHGQADHGNVDCSGDDLDEHALRDDAGLSRDRPVLHVLRQRRLASERDGGESVHGEVDEQQLNDGENYVLVADQGTEEADCHSRDVDGQLENQELPDALEHRAAVENSLLD